MSCLKRSILESTIYGPLIEHNLAWWGHTHGEAEHLRDEHDLPPGVLLESVRDALREWALSRPSAQATLERIVPYLTGRSTARALEPLRNHPMRPNERRFCLSTGDRLRQEYALARDSLSYQIPEP